MRHPNPSVLALLALLILCLGLVYALPASPTFAAPTADISIYTDSLASGWEDWSWDTTSDDANGAPVHSGSHSYAITYGSEWAGFYLRATQALNTAGYTHLRFFIHGGATGGQQMSLSINQDDGHTYPVTAPANTWQQVDVPLTTFNSPATISDIIWQDATGGAQATYYLDEIRLIAAPATAALPDPVADASRSGFDHPVGIAIAPSGRVYVAIFGNDGNDGQPFRQGAIHSWPTVTALVNGAAADIVLGQSGATQVGNPEALTVDEDNRLYVADTGNHRVLIYNSVTTSGQQPDFVFGAQGNSSQLENKFNFTRGLAVDQQSHLFVTDEFNNRVLVYNLPITSNNPTPFAQFTGLNGPRAVAVDRQNNVYIADSQHAQVKRFAQPIANNNYTTPAQTFGQLHDSDCNTTAGSTAADFLSCPIDLALDATGNLVVSDTPNHRVLGYLADSTTPTVVYGQADFQGFQANRGGAAANDTLAAPLGMAFAADGKLYLADFDNGRVLVFNAPTVTPPTATPTATATSVGPTATPTATSVPSDITLTVNAQADRHPISDLIYGMHAVADEDFAQAIDLPIRRWGGNNTTRYNWQLGATNHGSDWYFHNGPAYDQVTLVDMDADQWIQRNQRTGTRSLITIPMIGYVAKDGNQATCAFPVAKYPLQDDVDDEDGFPNCGDGLKNGVPIQADPSDTSIAIDASFIQQWITHLQQNAATNGAVEFYGLDNEPDIWFETHRDLFPTGWKYDEFRDRSYSYAAALKAIDPNAQVLGPVVNGWTYYWHGAWDGQREDWETPDDRNAHGGTPFVAWYLQQMKAYEDQHGVRLLDYLDLHYYPQNRDDAAAISLAPAGDAATQARRLRATRSLWDPTYIDESWIADVGPDDGIIQLLPRMKAWVAQNYPGTKLALSEYNWGGLESINGALAQADVLGIFGREGLDLATLFDPAQGDPLQTTFPSSPGAFAFRMYRDYDGQGGHFGDTSLQASSSDQGQLSIYAAQRSADNAITLMIINKSATQLSATANLAGFTPGTAAQVFRYAQNDLTQIVRLPDQPLRASGFTADFPANSITLLLMPTQAQPAPLDQTVLLPFVRR